MFIVPSYRAVASFDFAPAPIRSPMRNYLADKKRGTSARLPETSFVGTIIS
jgi:hypothetical protein